MTRLRKSWTGLVNRGFRKFGKVEINRTSYSRNMSLLDQDMNYQTINGERYQDRSPNQKREFSARLKLELKSINHGGKYEKYEEGEKEAMRE